MNARKAYALRTQSAAFEEARRMRERGLSFRRISARLNSQGIYNDGDRWQPTSVLRMFRRFEEASK